MHISSEAAGRSSACRACGQRYEVEALKRTTEQRLFEDSRRLAQQHSIDVPGAYSVLLGIMTLEEVREIGEAGSPGPAQGQDLQEIHYDPAFGKAVADGLLTARQAMERGNRESYAALLVKRHDLSIDAAYRVADGRASLLETLRERGGGTRDPLRVSVLSGPARPVKWAAAAALLLGTLSLAFYVKSGRPVGAGRLVTEKIGAVELLLDTGGRVFQVSGPNPRSVLRAYCGAALPGRRLELVNLIAAAQPGARLGLVRDPADVSKLLAVTIREDAATQRWIAGDGLAPIVAGPAPAGAETATERR
jgi:hypothetical protein